MPLDLVREFIQTLPKYQESSDGRQATVDCFECGGYSTRPGGCMSILIDPEPGTPMFHKCWRASCGASGFLTPEKLEKMGCSDIETLVSLADYNKTINIKSGKRFTAKRKREYQLVNLNTKANQNKLRYINNRLGINFSTTDLRNFKIQLSLYDFLNINSIYKLAYSEKFCDMLDQYAIGFMSMYSDYLICRDITKDLRTGRRYTTYRASGTPDKNDMKLYCVPAEIKLLSPQPADINIAEGPFSILGAYLHTSIGRDHENNIWLANCGSEYTNTILHTVKQYGLLHVCLHIWSDSEIKLQKYEKLLERIRDRMKVVSMYVHYNSKSDDFGHPKSQIAVDTVKII